MKPRNLATAGLLIIILSISVLLFRNGNDKAAAFVIGVVASIYC